MVVRQAHARSLQGHSATGIRRVVGLGMGLVHHLVDIRAWALAGNEVDQKLDIALGAGDRRGDEPGHAVTETLGHVGDVVEHLSVDLGLRTIPPFPTFSGPASNCGFTSAMISPSGARRSRTAGRTFSSEMKETSITARSGVSGSASGRRWRMLVRSRTVTRGSLRSFQASWP